MRRLAVPHPGGYLIGMSTLILPEAGRPIASEADALDLIGEAGVAGASRVVIPVRRLAPDFFRLDTGLAGAILQKCTNYRLAVVIVGDIAPQLAASSALRDFVRESNRQGAVRFIPALDAL